jgi:hypothetical protein
MNPMFLFGFSLHPAIRAIVGIVALVLGIALHLVILDAVGAIFVAISGYQVYRRRGGTQGPRGLR